MPPAAGDRPTIAAVLDIGSNSVLLLTVAIGPGGRARAVDEALETTRLGAGLADGRPLDAAAAGRTEACIVRLAARARACGARERWAFGTGAMRRAADGAAFARRLAAVAGVGVEVLSGAREASLAWEAVVHALDVGPGPLLVADVGGATTELTLGRLDTPSESASLRLGALALTEAHLRGDPPAETELAHARAEIASVLGDSPVPRRARELGVTLAASGGTATALAALHLGLQAYEPRRVHGHALSRTALDALVGRLGAQPLAERARSGAVEPGRAAILPAGALIIQGLVRAVGVSSVTVSDHGVRHAYLRARLAEHGVVADLRALWT